MPGKITLAATQASKELGTWCFESRDVCLIGRHAECGIQVPDDEANRTTSRHHALIDINPPTVRIRDFGSLNGTYVNDEKIGARLPGQSAQQGMLGEYPERDLQHDDVVRVGDITLAVTIDPGPVMSVGAPCGSKNDDVSLLLNEMMERADASSNAGSESSNFDLRKLTDYEIVRELGRGGMGAVYLARHRKTGLQVALKVMLPQGIVDERARRLFQREVQLTSALKHPNVVSLFESGYVDDLFFFTLDYCELGSVRDHFFTDGADQPTINQAFIVILQVLDGLDYLANVPLTVRDEDGSTTAVTGIVHRDLTPENILLTRQGDKLVAKISDVGLGKAFDLAGLSGLTMTGQSFGKPFYMPRQQVLDYRFAKPEVDVWAAAAVLYLLLTSEFPRDFPDGEDPWKVLLTTNPVPIRKRIDCPKPVAEVIDRALVDKPQLYYKRARDFGRDLVAAMRESGLL